MDGGHGSARAGAGVSNFSAGGTADEPAVTISYLVESTTITYTGPASSFTGDPVPLAVRLTSANGQATCSITPAESAGNYRLAIDYGGDVIHQPSSTEGQFAVTRKPTTLIYTGAVTGDFHNPATVLPVSS